MKSRIMAAVLLFGLFAAAGFGMVQRSRTGEDSAFSPGPIPAPSEPAVFTQLPAETSDSQLASTTDPEPEILPEQERRISKKSDYRPYRVLFKKEKKTITSKEFEDLVFCKNTISSLEGISYALKTFVITDTGGDDSAGLVSFAAIDGKGIPIELTLMSTGQPRVTKYLMINGDFVASCD